MSPAPNLMLTMAGGSSADPLDVLDNAAGAFAFWHSSYGVTTSTGRVINWVDRISSISAEPGSGTTDAPDFSGAAPNGQTGITGVIARNSILACSDALFDAMDALKPSSFLMVRKRSAVSGINKAEWRYDSGTGAYTAQRLDSTNRILYRRELASSANTAVVGSATEASTAVVVTGVYNGSVINEWSAGATRIVNSSNTRSMGAAVGSSMSMFYDFTIGAGDSTIWALLFSSVAWTAGQRAAYEAAANDIWIS